MPLRSMAARIRTQETANTCRKVDAIPTLQARAIRAIMGRLRDSLARCHLGPSVSSDDEPCTFWAASAQIMQELALLLPAGAVCAWVVKAYVKNKAIVPFPQQWQALCEQYGFVLLEEIHASLVEDHGTQEGLFGEARR